MAELIATILATPGSSSSCGPQLKGMVVSERHRERLIAVTRIVVILLALMSASACSSPDEDMKSWQGHHQSELILAWGPPIRTASDGNGGTVLIYEFYSNQGQIPGQVYVDPYSGNGWVTAPQQTGYTRSRMFYVNADGIIYAYKWQGL